MKVQGWKYYNHAAVPICAPHENPDLTPIEDGTIWSLEGNPLLARWITDWDCRYETNWWYIICDGIFDLEKLSRSSRKNIRKSLDNCEVKRVDPNDCSEDLWRVFQEATARYKNYQHTTDKEYFIQQCKNAEDNQEYWAGFDRATGRMIGYKICVNHDTWVDYSVSKYSAEYLKLRVSDALNAVTLEYYLNSCNKQYVSNGTRSVVHETNVQDYYQEHFNFRKAYCKLHIRYRRPLKLIVDMFYPFRNNLPNKGRMHYLVSLLKMEEFQRG